MDSITQKTPFQKIVVIIPAYNEEKTIGQVIKEVKNHVDNIIVIDDGSGDQTYSVAKNSAQNIVVLRHKINLGKGAALKTGCEAALKLNADIIAIMDADGQHSPKDLLKLLNKLQKENLDIVFGMRPMNKEMPILMRLGNKFLTKTINILFGISIQDTQSGLRTFTKNAYYKIKWLACDYFAETEMIINAAKNRLKYQEVPIETIYHDTYKGTTIFDGIKVFINILKNKFI